MQNKIFLTNKFLFFSSLYSLSAILFAFYYQYLENYPPCELCIYQRIPYIFILAFALLSLIFIKSKKIIIIFIPLAFLTSLVLSTFHFGVEQSYWEFGSKYSNQGKNFNDIDELRSFLYEVPLTKCNEVLWSFYGISMAGYNMIFSLFAFLTSSYFLRKIFT